MGQNLTSTRHAPSDIKHPLRAAQRDAPKSLFQWQRTLLSASNLVVQNSNNCSHGVRIVPVFVEIGAAGAVG